MPRPRPHPSAGAQEAHTVVRVSKGPSVVVDSALAWQRVDVLLSKACELCFKKKIKCDMLKPKCSNCCLYQAECRSSLQRRGSVGPARGKPALSQQQAL
jgi:hypothetical protein